jgi:hypothetical protein
MARSDCGSEPITSASPPICRTAHPRDEENLERCRLLVVDVGRHGAPNDNWWNRVILAQAGVHVKGEMGHETRQVAQRNLRCAPVGMTRPAPCRPTDRKPTGPADSLDPTLARAQSKIPIYCVVACAHFEDRLPRLIARKTWSSEIICPLRVTVRLTVTSAPSAA